MFLHFFYIVSIIKLLITLLFKKKLTYVNFFYNYFFPYTSVDPNPNDKNVTMLPNEIPARLMM
jgi:hypothetical protein